MGFYLLWVRIVLDGMMRTEETITFSEVMAPHARMHATVMQSTGLADLLVPGRDRDWPACLLSPPGDFCAALILFAPARRFGAGRGG